MPSRSFVFMLSPYFFLFTLFHRICIDDLQSSFSRTFSRLQTPHKELSKFPSPPTPLGRNVPGHTPLRLPLGPMGRMEPLLRVVRRWAAGETQALRQPGGLRRRRDDAGGGEDGVGFGVLWTVSKGIRRRKNFKLMTASERTFVLPQFRLAELYLLVSGGGINN